MTRSGEEIRRQSHGGFFWVKFSIRMYLTLVIRFGLVVLLFSKRASSGLVRGSRRSFNDRILKGGNGQDLLASEATLTPTARQTNQGKGVNEHGGSGVAPALENGKNNKQDIVAAEELTGSSTVFESANTASGGVVESTANNVSLNTGANSSGLQQDTTPSSTSYYGNGNGKANATQELNIRHYVRLAPFYWTVSLRGDINEPSFMEFLANYMDGHMKADLKGFFSITYGSTDFSKITDIPVSNTREGNVMLGSEPVYTNITVHVHRLTAAFDSEMVAPDLFVAEYMDMLLENAVMFQGYLDSWRGINATVLQIDLRYNIPSTSTDSAQNLSEKSKSGDKVHNLRLILGLSVGGFIVLLWMVFLYGLHNRPVVDFNK